jgi:uncharacterized protein (TIGR03083 family)
MAAMTTTIDVSTLAPLDHRTAIGLQHEELRRFLTLLRSLSAADWSRRTDCPEWDVRQVALHVLGQLAGAASPFTGYHQHRAGKRRRRQLGGSLVANVNAAQVAERDVLTHDRIVDALERVGHKGINRRRKLIGWFRRHMTLDNGRIPAERWTLGYTVDIVALRDLWMHRIDIARASERLLEVSADHDRLIVADVVRDWATRHHKPFSLVVLGPAGGWYSAGAEAGERHTIDAVELCRILGGRAPGSGLLTTPVPF